MSEHEQLEESIAAWVLGAMESEEAEAIAAHVDGCSTCREIANRLRRVVEVLPLAAHEVEPAPRLRQRILTAAGSPPPPAPRVASIRPRREARRRRGFGQVLLERVPIYAAAAGLLLALVVGVVVGEVAGRIAQPAAPTQVARFTLSGHGAMAGARANVIELKSDGIALVDFSGLPPLEQGNVYELWLIKPNQQAEPAGVFVPDSTGAKMVVVGKPLAGYATMAVTTERGPDGVQSPTQQPALYGSVA